MLQSMYYGGARLVLRPCVLFWDVSGRVRSAVTTGFPVRLLLKLYVFAVRLL